MKASLQMLLIAAVAALALFVHKGAPTITAPMKAPAKPPVASVQKPPTVPHSLYVGDDSSADAPIVARLGLGRSQEPVPFQRPKVPVFTDIGQQADLASSHFTQSAGDTGSDAAQMAATKDVPYAAVVFQVADMLLGGGNAAGLSPQQMAYACPGRKCSANALALAEGRMGTKQILINGDYVTIGGAALGGPGWADAEAAVAEERLSLRAAPTRLLG